MALPVGVHQRVNPVAYGPQPYGAVSVNYNLSSPWINKHLDGALDSYGEWKKVEEGDVVRNSEVLEQELLDGIPGKKKGSNHSRNKASRLRGTCARLANRIPRLHSTYNQLTAAQLLLEIETGDVTFRLDHLHRYLAKNY